MITKHRTSLLRVALIARGLTQRELAQAIGKNESTVNRWTQGLVPRAENRASILEFLNAANGESLTEDDVWPT